MNKLDNKIKSLEKKINDFDQRKKDNSANNKKAGFGFKISIEIVAALIVGVGIGLIVDNYFNSKPFGLIIFFILGALAGFFNVYRVMRQIENNNNSRI